MEGEDQVQPPGTDGADGEGAETPEGEPEAKPAAGEAEGKPAAEASSAAEGAGGSGSSASALDGLLSGKDVPADIAFYTRQALENDTPITAEQIAELSPEAKQVLAAILARQTKAASSLETFAKENDGKVAAAAEALKAAQKAKAEQLEFVRGEKVKALRAELDASLGEQAATLDPNDPDYVQKAIKLAGKQAAREMLGEFFSAIDTDAQARDQAVRQTALDESLGQYEQGFEAFINEHRGELEIAGHKETIQLPTGKVDARGQPVLQDHVIPKRTPLALEIHRILTEYGTDPNDPRRYRMDVRDAYTLALNKLSAETDKAEHESSQVRARERVAKPTQVRPPPLKPPPVNDSKAMGQYLSKNPEAVKEIVAEAFPE